jgi:hypothetical protein
LALLFGLTDWLKKALWSSSLILVIKIMPNADGRIYALAVDNFGHWRQELEMA